MPRYTTLTNAQFLLAETTLTIQALESGTTWAELLQAAQESRLYGPGKANSQRTVLNAIKSRMKGVPLGDLNLLASGSLEDRQLLNLALIARQKPLVMDFLVEVVVPKWQRLERQLTDADARAYLLQKAVEEPELSTWTSKTQTNTRANLTRFLLDGGLLKQVKKGQFELAAPFQSAALKPVLARVNPRFQSVLEALQ